MLGEWWVGGWVTYLGWVEELEPPPPPVVLIGSPAAVCVLVGEEDVEGVVQALGGNEGEVCVWVGGWGVE